MIVPLSHEYFPTFHMHVDGESLGVYIIIVLTRHLKISSRIMPRRLIFPIITSYPDHNINKSSLRLRALWIFYPRGGENPNWFVTDLSFSFNATTRKVFHIFRRWQARAWVRSEPVETFKREYSVHRSLDSIFSATYFSYGREWERLNHRGNCHHVNLDAFASN